MLKFFKDENKVVENDLNPCFYRCNELDCVLPEDWKLDIRIRNS